LHLSASVLHYGQEVESGRFSAFDFGKKKNLEVYNQTMAPDYKLSVIHTPVATYWSLNDLLSDPEVFLKFVQNDKLGKIIIMMPTYLVLIV
jgi:hypothetical protein